MDQRILPAILHPTVHIGYCVGLRPPHGLLKRHLPQVDCFCPAPSPPTLSPSPRLLARLRPQVQQSIAISDNEIIHRSTLLPPHPRSPLQRRKCRCWALRDSRRWARRLSCEAQRAERTSQYWREYSGPQEAEEGEPVAGGDPADVSHRKARASHCALARQ